MCTMKQQPRPRSSHPLIMGRNCVREVLRAAADRLIEVYVGERLDREGEELLKELRSVGIDVSQRSRDSLTALVGSDSHQGMVAAIRDRPYLDLKDVCGWAKERERLLLLMLDSIMDPHNFGAILRAAECFGVDGVLWSRNRGCDITPVVAKVSVGASELLPLVPVSNLAQALERLKDAGVWSIAADVSPEAQPIDQFEFPTKSLILLGSEGEGLQPLLLREAEFKITIPLCGKIDSLNVSQAAAVMLAAARRAVGS